MYVYINLDSRSLDITFRTVKLLIMRIWTVRTWTEIRDFKYSVTLDGIFLDPADLEFRIFEIGTAQIWIAYTKNSDRTSPDYILALARLPPSLRSAHTNASYTDLIPDLYRPHLWDPDFCRFFLTFFCFQPQTE